MVPRSEALRRVQNTTRRLGEALQEPRPRPEDTVVKVDFMSTRPRVKNNKKRQRPHPRAHVVPVTHSTTPIHVIISTYVGLVVSLGALTMMVGTAFTTTANLQNAVMTLQSEVKRNFEEDRRFIERYAKDVERVDNRIDALTKGINQIAVVETKMTAIDETLKRIERQLDRQHAKDAHPYK